MPFAIPVMVPVGTGTDGEDAVIVGDAAASSSAILAVHSRGLLASLPRNTTVFVLRVNRA